MKHFLTNFLRMGSAVSTPPIRSAMRSILLVLGLFLSVSVWGDNAEVGDVLWGETWTGATTGNSGSNTTKASANCSTTKGTTMWGGATITYSESANTVYVRNEELAGGTGHKPELMLTSSQTWTISNIPTGGATEMTLTYASNNTKSSVTCSTTGVSISGSSKSYTIDNSTAKASTITLVFGCSGNTRIDDVQLTVKTAGSGSGNTTDCTEPGTALSITSANTATIGTPLTLTSDGGNGGDITWSVTDGTGSATVSGNTLTPVTKGTVTVTATQAENIVDETTYCGAAPTKTITISKAPLTPIEGGINDVLDNAWTGKSSSSYGDVAQKSAANAGHSSAEYVAQCAGDNTSIQLRSNNNNSGVVSTVSAGYVKRIEVEWNDNTDGTRILDIYGSNTAYTAATNLYNNATQGTLLGSLNKGEGETVLDFTEWTGDYKYIGFRSKSGAMYLTSVTITWVPLPTYAVGISSTGCELSVKKGTNDVSDGDKFEAGTELTITNEASTGYENAQLVIKKAEDNSDVTTSVLSGSTLTMPNYAINIEATATKKSYTVTLAATNGKIQVGGEDKTSISVAHGETAQLTAVANDGYAFNGWSSNSADVVLTDAANPATITVTGAGTITASFRSTAKADPEISWSAASANAVKGQTASLPTLNNPNVLDVTYSSSNTTVAEIDGDGNVTIKGVGSAVITAAFTEDENYAGDEKSYTLNVKGRVTWHVIKGGVDDPTYADYAKDETPVMPTPASCDESISLVGWTTSEYAKSDNAPATLYTDNVPEVTDNADYYAVWAKVEEGGWNEVTTVAGLTAGTYAICSDDYFMKAEKNSSKNRLNNGEATPSISANKLTSAPASDCQWTLSVINDKYMFQNGSNYLRATNTKNEAMLGDATSDAEYYQWTITIEANEFVVRNVAREGLSTDNDKSYLRNNDSYGWAAYSSTQGSAPRFFKYSAGSATDYTTNCVAPLTVAAPAFNVEAGTYTSVQTVTITCATDGATIYYSLDGNDPTTEYTAPIEISETKTLKAKAVLEYVSSDVTSATYTINLPLTTIQKIFDEAALIGGTAQERVITFNNWVVSAISEDDKSVYVTDGEKGFVIYGSGHGFAVGNILSGTVTCDLQLYGGFAEIKGMKYNAQGLNVTTGGTLNPHEVSLKNLGAINTGAPIIIDNVTYDNDGDLVDAENYFATPVEWLYTFGSSTFETGKIYKVTGIYIYGSTAGKIVPRNAGDIVKLTKEQPTITWKINDTPIEESYSIDNKDVAFAPVCVANSTGAKSYESSNTSVATIDEYGVITVNGNGVTTITCTVEADDNYVEGSKSFDLKVGVGEASWVASTWASDNSITSNTNFANDYETIAIDANVSMTWAKVTSGASIPAYNNGDKEGRLYANTSLTFTASNSKQITSITFHFTPNYAGTISASEGTYSNAEWDGFATSVTFTNANGAGQARIKSIDIEYAQGVTSTLEIEDIELSMLVPAGQTIEYTSNRTSPTIVYSDYDDEVIAINNGVVTPVAVGQTTVKASIAAAAPYSSVVTTFKVVVKSGVEVEGNVVILAEKDGVWYAMTNTQGSANNSLAAIVVDYNPTYNKIFNLDPSKEASIIWKRTVDGANVTFQDANNKYLTGGSSSTNLSVADAKCVWTKSNDNYLQGDRSFLYSTTNGYFRCYTPSTAGVTDMPVVTLSDDIFVTRADIRSGLSEGKWGTICPKQEVKYPAGAAFYQLTYMELNTDGSPYKFFFDEIAENASLEAGKPYLFIADGEVIKGVKVGESVNNGDYAHNGFVGYIGGGKHISSDNDVYTGGATNYYGLQNNVFKLIYSTSSTNNILDERAYVEISPTRKPSTTALPMPAYSKRRLVVGAGAPAVTTGMDELNASEAPVKVMIDGQLFIIRGEKMYNANGQLVK